MIAVRPSRMSSPETRSSRFLIRPHSSPQLLTSEVSAARKPSSWVPPSWVLMVLAKVCTDSVKVVFHCIATSRLMWFSAVVGRLGLEGDDRRVGLVLAAVEVLDVVDEAAVVLEDPLDAAALAALDRVGAGLVDVVGDGVVLDGVERRSSAAGRSSRTTISRPLLRKAISRNRLVIVSRE